MLSTLHSQHFLLDPCSLLPNARCFVIPKTSEKCSLICDMRAINELTVDPIPTFSLPTLSDLTSTFCHAPPSGLWGCKLDIKNFYWSLRLRDNWRQCFRVSTGTFPCLPFGWHLAPLIAQRTMEAFCWPHLTEVGLLPFLFHSLFLFIYLDDILIICTTQQMCLHFTTSLSDHLQSRGLVISPKSETTPCQSLTWLGKHLDLQHGSISNTLSTTLRALGLVLLASSSHLTKKRLQTLLGTLNWAFRPRPGFSLFTWAWYGRLHHIPFSTGFATRDMRHILFDLFATLCIPWASPSFTPKPLLCPQFCMEAASCPGTSTTPSFQIGIFSPLLDCRIHRAPHWAHSQQLAEYFGILYCMGIVSNLSLPYAHLISDNQASLACILQLRPFRGHYPLLRYLRRVFNKLWRSPTILHFSWVPSEYQPADPLSRLDPSSPTQLQLRTRLAHALWVYLLKSYSHFHHVGCLYIS